MMKCEERVGHCTEIRIATRAYMLERDLDCGVISFVAKIANDADDSVLALGVVNAAGVAQLIRDLGPSRVELCVGRDEPGDDLMQIFLGQVAVQ